jgi:hypothetical protein
VLVVRHCAIRGPQKLCKLTHDLWVKSSGVPTKGPDVAVSDQSAANKCGAVLSLFAASEWTSVTNLRFSVWFPQKTSGVVWHSGCVAKLGVCVSRSASDAKIVRLGQRPPAKQFSVKEDFCLLVLAD